MGQQMTELQPETMIEHQYQPPERKHQHKDTLTAWSVQIRNDPHGSVNKIITLARYGKPIKTILCPLQPDDEVNLVRDHNQYSIDEVLTAHNKFWETGEIPQFTQREPGWRIVVDGKTIMSITDTQIAALTPAPKAAPRTPLRTRLRRALTEQTRKDLDAIAKHLGYHRDEHCTGWD